MAGRTNRQNRELRKQALILESALNRRLLADEWQEVRTATSWISEARKLGIRARTWWPLIAPLAGIVVARRFRQPAPRLSRTGSWLNLLGLGYSVWRRLGPRKGRHRSRAAGER